MTIFVVDVNIIEESMTMVEQSIDTSIDMMNSLGQPVPENFEEKMRDSMEMIRTLIPSALVIIVNDVILFIYLGCTTFCKTV